MIKTDPIIAVQDVERSAKWYQSLFGCQNMHAGTEFAILAEQQNEVILCLHKWGEHEHPTMKDRNTHAGNGLILYFRTDKIDTIHNNALKLKCKIEKEMGLNPNSKMREFSLWDPDGYYLTVSEYHNYGG